MLNAPTPVEVAPVIASVPTPALLQMASTVSGIEQVAVQQDISPLAVIVLVLVAV